MTRINLTSIFIIGLLGNQHWAQAWRAEPLPLPIDHRQGHQNDQYYYQNQPQGLPVRKNRNNVRLVNKDINNKDFGFNSHAYPRQPGRGSVMGVAREDEVQQEDQDVANGPLATPAMLYSEGRIYEYQYGKPWSYDWITDRPQQQPNSDNGLLIHPAERGYLEWQRRLSQEQDYHDHDRPVNVQSEPEPVLEIPLQFGTPGPAHADYDNEPCTVTQVFTTTYFVRPKPVVTEYTISTVLVDCPANITPIPAPYDQEGYYLYRYFNDEPLESRPPSMQTTTVPTHAIPIVRIPRIPCNQCRDSDECDNCIPSPTSTTTSGTPAAVSPTQSELPTLESQSQPQSQFLPQAAKYKYPDHDSMPPSSPENDDYLNNYRGYPQPYPASCSQCQPPQNCEHCYYDQSNHNNRPPRLLAAPENAAVPEDIYAYYDEEDRNWEQEDGILMTIMRGQNQGSIAAVHTQTQGPQLESKPTLAPNRPSPKIVVTPQNHPEVGPQIIRPQEGTGSEVKKWEEEEQELQW